jgi:hypothetical protein
MRRPAGADEIIDRIRVCALRMGLSAGAALNARSGSVVPHVASMAEPRSHASGNCIAHAAASIANFALNFESQARRSLGHPRIDTRIGGHPIIACERRNLCGFATSARRPRRLRVRPEPFCSPNTASDVDCAMAHQSCGGGLPWAASRHRSGRQRHRQQQPGDRCRTRSTCNGF